MEVPCSGKLSRERTFANWWKIQFSQRKLSQITHFCCTKEPHSHKNSHKTTKFAKVFFLESFVLYVSHWTSNLERTELLGTLLQALPTKLIAAVQDFCLQYDCKTEFEGENFHEFCSFVAIHESFLCKILGHGVLWRSTSEQSTKVFFVKITNFGAWCPLAQHKWAIH